MDGFFLKADDLGETEPFEDLDIEDFLDRSLELEQSDYNAATQVNNGDTALELIAPSAIGTPSMAEVGRIFDSPTNA